MTARFRYLDTWEPSSAMRADRDRVAEAFGIAPHVLVGRRRDAPTARVRHAACWVLHRRWPRLSWDCLGRLLGGRDHSTVIHGARAADGLRARCSDFRERTDALVDGLPIDPIEPAPRAIVGRCGNREEHDRIDLLAGRAVKPKNALDESDTDAVRRMAASQALGRAIAASGGCFL